ncbi:MAG: ABC transporter permease [Methanobrevibacter sp.]|nr:ABC transporter permease [Methanobrevibacter sp.]
MGSNKSRLSLSNVGKIFKGDLRTVSKNPYVLVTIIAIIIVPSLYALINIYACWDPYGNTGNLEYAFVNNDADATYNGQTINFGNSIVDELKNDNNFTWEFVSEEDARDGVKSGKYYAALIIPENFTKSVLSIQSQNPTQGQITYLVNEKTSTVASIMTGEAADIFGETINSNINTKVDSIAMQKLALFGTTAQIPQLAKLGLVNQTSAQEYFYSPVDIQEEAIYPVDNFGSSIAPFYIILSVWVGCVISIALIKTRSFTGEYKPLEMYFGRMGLFLIIALLQSTVTMFGSWCLGIQMSDPLLYVVLMYVTTIAFLILIYSIVSIFGMVGKAIAIILLVFQVLTTNGIYPAAALAPFAQALNQYFPMTYGIELLKNALLGVYWPNIMPSLYVMIGIIIGSIIVSVLIKSLFENAANNFEKKLTDSGLF